MDDSGHLDLGKYSEGQPIKSIFVPPYGLQGQHFSCHVTWFQDYELKSMNIKLEEGVELENIYNIDPTGIDYANDKEVAIKDVLENGYLGFMLKSVRLPVSLKIIHVSLRWAFSKGDKIFVSERSFPLEIIRPDLVLGEMPDTIEVAFDETADLIPEVPSAIPIINKGPGMAFLLVYPTEDCHVKMTHFFQEETIKFIEKLTKSLNDLRAEYQAYENIISLLIELFSMRSDAELGKTIDIDKFKENVKTLDKEVQKIENAGHDFLEDVGDVVSDVYHSVFTASKMFQGVLRSVENMKDQRISLINTFSAIDVETGTKLKLEFLHFDAMGVHYKELQTKEFSIKIKPKDILVRVPLYKLIDIGGIGNGSR